MKKLIILGSLLLILLGHSFSYAQIPVATPIQTTTSEIQPLSITMSQFDQLSMDQQKNIAAMWHLDMKDYRQYLWLMQNTPNGLYYKDRNLDPSWILGFNSKNDDDFKRYVTVAIQNERARIEKELAFQRAFTRIQQEMYPNDLPIRYSSQDQNKNTINKLLNLISSAKSY